MFANTAVGSDLGPWALHLPRTELTHRCDAGKRNHCASHAGTALEHCAHAQLYTVRCSLAAHNRINLDLRVEELDACTRRSPWLRLLYTTCDESQSGVRVSLDGGAPRATYDAGT